jgi:chitinase
MHLKRFFSGAILMLLGAGISIHARAAEPVIAGYVFPQSGEIHLDQVDARKLNRINFAFAQVVGGRMVVANANDELSLAHVTQLRRQNPALTVLISVGGWLGSGGFSDVALTAQSRSIFIQSTIDFLKQHNLDGVDIDWEYPADAGSGNKFRAEDKQNFTLLLKELRERMTLESKATRRRMYLTIAAGASDDYLAHTEMAKVQQYVDSVNLMAYDYYVADVDATTGNHAPLLTDPADPKKMSANASVKAFEAAGVPAGKIILGVPFYGRVWEHVADAHGGLFQQGKPSATGSLAYSQIKDTMLGHGFMRYWDAAAQAPYLYSKEQQEFVSYEDAESLGAKCHYITSHGLGGVSFWSYFNDPSGELLSAIDAGLEKRPMYTK